MAKGRKTKISGKQRGKMRKNVKMAILRGKGWGDHGIVSKLYLINEWKIQCKIFKIKIHEESVKIKEIEICDKRE